MPKFSDSKISYVHQDKLWDVFCGVLLKMHTSDEMKRFLKDLLNRQERLMLVRRLQIAEMLESGLTYEEIMKKIGAGAVTIARVHRWLKFGRNGYRQAIIHFRKLKS